MNRTIEDVVRDLRDALEALDAERDEKSSSELAEAMTRIEALAENANATAADEARAASETGDEDEAMHILREVVERWSGSESVGTSGRERGGEVKTTASRSRSTAAADEKDADEDKEEDGDGDDREEEEEEEGEEGEEEIRRAMRKRTMAISMDIYWIRRRRRSRLGRKSSTRRWARMSRHPRAPS